MNIDKAEVMTHIHAHLHELFVSLSDIEDSNAEADMAVEALMYSIKQGFLLETLDEVVDYLIEDE